MGTVYHDPEYSVDPQKFNFVSNEVKRSEEISGESLGYWRDSLRRLFQNKIATASVFFVILIYILSIIISFSSPHSSVIEPQIEDPKTGEIIRKQRLTGLPPRIKGLEWTGMFNGKIERLIPESSLDNSFYFKEGSYEIKECNVDRTGVSMCTIEHDIYEQHDVKFLNFAFGTDNGARDMWTRVWSGVRNSLTIAFLTAMFDIVLGVLYGSIAGFYGGSKLDNVMMRFIEIYGSIPSIVLLILLLSFMERGFFALVVAMGLTGWIGVARMVRAQFLRYRDHDFVLASKTIGASNKRLISKHIFPNIVGQIVILATFSVPSAIFYEASLSFIGLGLPIEVSSLGTLINAGINLRSTSPYLLWIPTIVLAVVMLAINLLANGLRDALDPKLRGR